MYDVWLMIQDTPCVSFDLDEFQESFAECENQMKQKYGKDRSSNIIEKAEMGENKVGTR